MHGHCKTDPKLLLKNSAKKCKLDCFNYVKNIKPVTIPRVKLKQSNSKSAFKWTKEAEIIEKLHAKHCHNKRIRTYDYSTNLPPDLYARVEKIITLPSITKDVFEQDALELEDDQFGLLPEEKSDKIEIISEKSFNESTCSFIEKLQQKFTEINLKTEETVYSLEKKRNVNWFSDYICQNKRKRIKWKTKLYKLDQDINDKPVDEQAEDMMEAVAERFSNWLNSYGTRDTNITKEYIRTLFNIDSGAKLLSGVKVNPRVIKAVPHYVAKTWGMPEMSMTNKFEKKLAQQKAIKHKPIITHAFGRTIPYRERPWKPSDAVTTIEPYCPDDIVTRSKIFDGIAHLKSTKELIGYLLHNPDVERPPYLVKNGWFSVKRRRTMHELDEMPLYELFDLARGER